MPPRNKQDDEDFRSFMDEDEDESGYALDDDGDFPVEMGQEIREVEDAPPQGDGKVFGMSAGERAFLSVVLFFNVLIMGAALLIVTGRVQL